MDRKSLADLNALRAARVPVVAVTDMTTGATRLVTEDKLAGDPLAGELTARFRSGKSGTLKTDDGELFLGVHVPPPRLMLVGAVHISQSLAHFARATGFDVTVVDPRTAFATPERFPGLPLIAEWPEVALPPLGVDRFTAMAALTHVPDIDDFALLHAMEKGCFYIGALGSTRTHRTRLERLGKKGASAESLARIDGPIGLDIGAANPPEIAVAILGKIIEALRKREVGA